MQTIHIQYYELKKYKFVILAKLVWLQRQSVYHGFQPMGWKNDLGERNTQNTVLYRNGNRYSKFVIREVSQVLLTNKVT